jgi:hypothetical protein
MSLELDASFDFGLAFGKLGESISDLKHEPPRPFYLSYKGSGRGNVAFHVGTPPAGMIWNILTVTALGDGDDHTSVPGQLALYVDSDETSLSVSQCVIPGLVIPSFVSISRGTLWAHSAGQVVANVTGTTGNPEVIVSISVAAWHEKDIAGRMT